MIFIKAMLSPVVIMILLAIFGFLFLWPYIKKFCTNSPPPGYSINSPLTNQKFGLTFFGKNGREKLRIFESKMVAGGFTDRFVVYDFFSNNDKRMNLSDNLHQWAVGIWINRTKKMVALRLDGCSSNEIVIPFEEFKRVDIMNGNPIGFSTGFQVRIVTENINSGPNSYILKLYDPSVGQTPDGVPSKLDISGSIYSSILECAMTIRDQISFIMSNPS